MKVIKAINVVEYGVQLNARSKPRVVHCNRLWKHEGEYKPTWLKTTKPPRNGENTPSPSPRKEPADNTKTEDVHASPNGNNTPTELHPPDEHRNELRRSTHSRRNEPRDFNRRGSVMNERSHTLIVMRRTITH